MPAARSIWNGTITFGSVAIPVKLFSATSPHTLRFREVRASDGATIEHRRIGAESGDEIEYADIEKAYDEGDDGQIVLTKEEIAAAEGTHPKVIAIEHFVRAEEIDPVFYDKPYLVGAQDDGVHGYRVLLAALEKSDKVGIGRFVLRSRENLVAVRPLGGALGIQTMRFDDELVDKSDLELPSLRKKPGAREVKMAGALVEMLQGDWEPEEQHDTYRDAVMDLIERKRHGKEPKKAKRKPEDGGDLADALEASLKGGKPKRKTAAERKKATAGASSAKAKASSGGSKSSSGKPSSGGSTSTATKRASAKKKASTTKKKPSTTKKKAAS
ncbi:Ku protein [Patulibacter minatonensis]|uniref:non-homologous end joining protein Ku n=1 Tax=Patulibacter minatonensis TaxID=298163 RepID=UPI000685B811|nr:Ku protein [Patulibacter minatonensis]